MEKRCEGPVEGLLGTVGTDLIATGNRIDKDVHQAENGMFGSRSEPCFLPRIWINLHLDSGTVSFTNCISTFLRHLTMGILLDRR